MRAIFLITLLSVGIFSCEEQVDPKPASLEGDWTVMWEFEGDLLYGHAGIHSGKAEFRAFGTQNSTILSGYEEASYTYSWDGEILKLKREDNGLIISYRLSSYSPDKTKFTYQEDITVYFIRK